MNQNDLPLYQCHKQVRAAKIVDIFRDSSVPLQRGSAWVLTLLNPAHPDGQRMRFDPWWVAKHQPAIGGYVVVYEDGYTSYSPADAFEKGYAKVLEKPAVPASVTVANKDDWPDFLRVRDEAERRAREREEKMDLTVGSGHLQANLAGKV